PLGSVTPCDDNQNSATGLPPELLEPCAPSAAPRYVPLDTQAKFALFTERVSSCSLRRRLLPRHRGLEGLWPGGGRLRKALWRYPGGYRSPQLFSELSDAHTVPPGSQVLPVTQKRLP